MNVPPEDPELLIVAAARPTMARLLEGLGQHGIRADLVQELNQARETFLARGGHRLLILAPDLEPGRARQISRSLAVVDPDLPVLSFGDGRAQLPTGARWVQYHPSSRAAVGAVLKALHEL